MGAVSRNNQTFSFLSTFYIKWLRNGEVGEKREKGDMKKRMYVKCCKKLENWPFPTSSPGSLSWLTLFTFFNNDCGIMHHVEILCYILSFEGRFL